jgi:hypothetical protein
MNQEIENQINAYLSDETKLYQDWYTTLAQTGATKQISTLPPLSELKQVFEQWLEQQKSIFTAKLCGEYCQKRQQLQEQESLLIAAVADILTVALIGMPVNSVAVAVILVTKKRLDKFCDCAEYGLA